MTALTIHELELPVGIWHPNATITCFECHCKDHGGPQWGYGSSKPMDPERYKVQPLDPHSDDEIAICDDCGTVCWMDGTIAKEQRIVRALKNKGINATMDQTGGMCSAASVYLPSDEDGGQKHVMITWSEDTRRDPNDPTFVVGYYHYENPYGDDAEGEDYSILPFDEAVALVEKIVKEGRLNA